MNPIAQSEGRIKFGIEELEQWKDEIAKWWNAERLRYSHKEMVDLFQKWFGITQKEAIRLEFKSRDNDEKWIEQLLEQIIDVFHEKLHVDSPIASRSLKMSFQNGAEATVLFQGQQFKHSVPGHVGIVGRVSYQDGRNQSIFQRFITHPFWQYSHRTSEE
jgi:hypothetical protein